MSKRTRTESGWSERARIARAINARINSKFPWKSYGRTYSKRGVADSPSMVAYGDSWKSATPAQRAARKEHGYYGRGGIIGDLAKVGGAALGGMVGGPAGAIAGEALGGYVGGKLEGRGLYTGRSGRYSGRGLYAGRGTYDSNSLVTGVDAAGERLITRPSIEFGSPNDETGTLILGNKEYVGDVYGPANSDFTNTSYDLNPGLVNNFPFLAQFAQNFEEYEFIQVVFEFHSTVDASSTNNPNGNTGTVIMATNYNVMAPPFVDKEQMIQYHGGVSGRMTENLIHGVECDPSKSSGAPQKYVRTGLPINQDLKTYDLGRFQIAFQNIPAAYQNQQVGELWVSYRVKLCKPRLFTALAGGIQQFRGTTASTEPTGTTVLSAAPPLLTAVNNSLAMQCDWLPTIGPYTQTVDNFTGAGYKLTFPASASGVFEIKIFMSLRGQAQGFAALAGSNINGCSWISPGNVTMGVATGGDGTVGSKGDCGSILTGNVENYNDIYSMVDYGPSGVGLPGDTGVSSSVCNYMNLADQTGQFGAASATMGCTGMMTIAHVRVRAATAGVDNSITIPLAPQNMTLSIYGRTVLVTEISPFQAISNTVDHSQYQNSAGVYVDTGPQFPNVV